ncbi:FAD-dependent oxidoreductase [Exilibacterium tricleocarpae]|uniref:FAD-dependent oxidoreductase n=1 Tax=Exilibacterium tricleocarpae TaxID=2591008 RepID=UPI0015D3F07C|nr:FAD-dependent oxidoreductase [Exilibacterium tricleocarpae]
MKPEVIVIGAGIAGLTAAACLLKNGYRVRVYEQSDHLSELGAGIQISANAGRVLHHLGLEEQLRQASSAPLTWLTRVFDSGEVINEISLGNHHEDTHGVPYYQLHRRDLHRMLVALVRSFDPGAITLSARAVGFTESDHAVTVEFANGKNASASIVIGADGIKSALRGRIVTKESITYTGNTAWRCVIAAEALPQHFMSHMTTTWVGPGRHMIMYWLDGGKMLNMVAPVERHEWAEESWTLHCPWEELKADFEGWHADVQSVIDACDRDACYRWALNSRAPVDNWRTDRVILIGDAAHPTLPFMAQGAAMAIEDAAVLARALESDEEPAHCLELFQQNRLSRTAKIVVSSQEMSHINHLATAEELRRAYDRRREITRDRDSWLYSYDPLRVALK